MKNKEKKEISEPPVFPDLKKYRILCPKCKSSFDCTEDIANFKREVIRATLILQQIGKLNGLVDLELDE